MKKYFFMLLAAWVVCSAVSAQVFVIERNSNTTLTFTNIKATVDALQDNDKLYLPPGSIDLSPYKWERLNTGTGLNEVILNQAVVFNKKISVFGGGYESENTTRFINGTVVLNKGASSSTLTGIQFEKLRLDTLSNVSVSRCKMLQNSDALTYGICLNNTFTECIFNALNSNVKGVNFTKCLIFKIEYFSLANSTFKNCIFANGFGNSNSSEGNTVFYNNIFITSKTTLTQEINIYWFSGCVFKNNLWVGGHPKIQNNNTHTDEIINQSYVNTFIDGDSYDYHLKSTSAGKNAGTDGTDVGIYGTFMPFKESKLPSIPHFSIKNIATETNAEGKLPVHIQIEAQDN